MRRPRLIAAALAALLLPSTAAAREPVRVLVPDDDNLQYMSFWLAQAAGTFADEDLDVEAVAPPSPKLAKPWFAKNDPPFDCAVLPPPVYLDLIAEKNGVVLVANLLKNDPIDLIVRRSVADERHLSASEPLHDRLAGLHGLRVGVAPHPPTRLRALFASQGLDADHDLSLVILHGPEQNEAFASGKVDALYAHTPYLEHALVHDDAVMLVEQTRGEVPGLANRQIHALVADRRVVDQHRTTMVRMVRAIARAEALIHSDRHRAADALARRFPSRDRAEIDRIVELYEPAVPDTPDVRAEDLAPALALYPAGVQKPSLDGIDLAAHVDDSLARDALRPPSTPRRTRALFFAAAALVAGALAAFRTRASRRARRGDRSRRRA